MEAPTPSKGDILNALNKAVSEAPIEDLRQWAEKHGFSADEVVGVAKSETAHERFTMSPPVKVETFEATPEGKEVKESGSPEARLYGELPIFSETGEGWVKRADLEAKWGKALSAGTLYH